MQLTDIAAVVGKIKQGLSVGKTLNLSGAVHRGAILPVCAHINQVGEVVKLKHNVFPIPGAVQLCLHVAAKRIVIGCKSAGNVRQVSCRLVVNHRNNTCINRLLAGCGKVVKRLNGIDINTYRIAGRLVTDNGHNRR